MENTIRAKRIKPHCDMVGIEAVTDEQDGGAVPALALLAEHALFAENEAANCSNWPFAGIVNPVNVKLVAPKEPTGTEATALPVRFNTPLAGALEKVTVTLAVKVSSVALLGVPLLLQTEILEVVIPVMAQLGGATEQEAGAVPALLFDNVQVGVAEKVAVRLMGVPSALMVTPVKVCDVAPKAPTATDAVPSPVRFNVPVVGGVENVTVTFPVKVSSLGVCVPWLLQAEILLTAIALIAHAEAQATLFTDLKRQATPDTIPVEPAGLLPGSTNVAIPTITLPLGTNIMGDGAPPMPPMPVITLLVALGDPANISDNNLEFPLTPSIAQPILTSKPTKA
jgi:hypothetical protein